MTCVFSFYSFALHRCKEVHDNERHRTREQSTSGVFLLLCSVRSFVRELLLCIAFLRFRSFPFFFLLSLFTLPPHGGLLIGGPGNGAPPPSESSPYAIIYNPRAEMKHIPKVYDAAPLNDRLKELIRAFKFVSINHGCFAKLGPLQGFNFFTSIH